MVQPDPYPLPPDDIAARTLPIETMAAGTALCRIHRSDLGAVHFGKAGNSRFDDPQGLFGICYFARSIEGAFAETCLRDVGSQFVAFTFLDVRSVTTLTVARPLRLVSLHGTGLAAVGATSAISAGPHASAQAWSRALYDHADQPDGLVYRANHDNGEHCVALFDRAADAIVAGNLERLTADRQRLADILARYKAALG